MRLKAVCWLALIFLMLCLCLQACSSLGKPPLIKAAETGAGDVLDRLLSEGAAVDDATKSGVTALFSAAANGHEAIALRLVEKGADTNSAISGPYVNEGWTLSKGATPLMAALSGGHVNIADILLQHGAEVAVSDENGYTPLMLAAALGNTGLTSAIVQKKPGVNSKTSIPPLIAAAASASPEVVALLLKNGADTKTQVPKDFIYKEVTVFSGGNALMAAAEADDDKSLQLLIDAGADVNLAAKNGTTALMAAASKGSLGAADLLIAQGANVNARTTETYTIGKHAVSKGSTALAEAALAGHADMVQFLISNGADVNAKDDDTNIDALFLAASEGHLETVNVLISNGAEVYAETKMGSAFCIADHYGHQEVVDVIAAARKKAEDKKEKKSE